jgi:hypothetical protein
MALWQFITQHRDGAAISDIVALIDRRLTFQLNRPPIITANLLANDVHARRDDTGGLQPGVHELKIYRDQSAIETVYALTSATVTAGENSVMLGFEWQGIMSYLQDGTVYAQSTAYSSSSLAWDWIDTFQTRTNGDYGILESVNAAGSRQKSIQQDTGLLDAIIQLSESGNEFDFTIDTNRGWVEYTQRGDDNNLVFEYGVNLLGVTYVESAGPGEIANAVRVIGPPGTQIVSANNTSSQTVYGRREASLAFFADFELASVTTGQLQAHADAAILQRTRPVIVPQVKVAVNQASVDWGAYWLGDTVELRINVGNYDTIAGEYRIVQIDVELDANDNESIMLGLNTV